jgi:large subunit ribosomal protein L6
MKPVSIKSGVTITVDGSQIKVKGSKGELVHALHRNVVVAEQSDAEISFAPAKNDQSSLALVGTTRALMANMIAGVSAGFEKKLELVGVGYRAQSAGKVLNLSLGFSHPVEFAIPDGIAIETPSQTEIVIKGTDRQQVGQVAANIRAYREPEPYKGKGIRYSGEKIIRKEAKKK